MADAMEQANKVLSNTRWQPLRPLGSGGGGAVFLCVSRELVSWFAAFEWRVGEYAHALATGRRGGPRPATNAETLIERLVVGIRAGEALAAVKIPHAGDTQPARFEREVAAMRDYSHPALIRLLDADESKPPGWFAMPAHLAGSLDDPGHRAKFLGRPREILRAVRPIAEALTKMHEGRAVHRDVKPKNIFVADDGRLILGDLGIVIPAPDATRMTGVGDDPAHSRDWVPDWVQFGDERTYGTEVDVFALAKVIYFLLSGSNVMASQMYKEGPRLLERYSDAHAMAPTMSLLQRCIVTRQDEVTVRDASTFLREIDDLLASSALSLTGLPFFSFLSTSDRTDCVLQNSVTVPGRRMMPDVDGLSAIPIHLAVRTKALVARVRTYGVQDGFSLQVWLGDMGTRRWDSRGSYDLQRPGSWTDPLVLEFDRPVEAGWHTMTISAFGKGALSGLSLIYP